MLKTYKKKREWRKNGIGFKSNKENILNLFAICEGPKPIVEKIELSVIITYGDNGKK